MLSVRLDILTSLYSISSKCMLNMPVFNYEMLFVVLGINNIFYILCASLSKKTKPVFVGKV